MHRFAAAAIAALPAFAAAQDWRMISTRPGRARRATTGSATTETPPHQPVVQIEVGGKHHRLAVVGLEVAVKTRSGADSVSGKVVLR